MPLRLAGCHLIGPQIPSYHEKAFFERGGEMSHIGEKVYHVILGTSVLFQIAEIRRGNHAQIICVNSANEEWQPGDRWTTSLSNLVSADGDAATEIARRLGFRRTPVWSQA